MLSNFTVRNPLLDPSLAWGGGHTVASDPMKEGWRIRAISPSSSGVLVGRRGIAGCFSAMPLSDGQLDVAIYLDTPEEVSRLFKEGSADARYIKVACIPGWALHARDSLMEELRD